MQGSVKDKGRRLQKTVKTASQGVSAARMGIHDMDTERRLSKDRCNELEQERNYLQIEVTEHSADAASTRHELKRLKVLLPCFSAIRLKHSRS